MQLGRLEAEGPQRLLKREQHFGGRGGLRFRAGTDAADEHSASGSDEDNGEPRMPL